MSSFWLTVWATTLSCSWLLPNHYLPWTAFHTDAWSGLAFLGAAIVVLLRFKKPVEWHLSAVVVAVACFIPAIQHLAGLVLFAGQAWIVSLYLLGLLGALLLGQRWEQAQAGQLADGLLLAIGLASIVSVTLQLQTWLGLIDTGIFDIWTMGLSGARPYANLGQPNQLATLLLWGLLGGAWAVHTRRIGAIAFLSFAMFLLMGIALTQSRTAWIGLSFLVACTWYWRHLWRSRRLPWIATGLFICFWTINPLLHMLQEFLGFETSGEYFRQGPQGDLRFAAWELFSRAVTEHPWLGYGWTTVGRAQLSLAEAFPPLYPTFGHSHNLFLDFALWLGLPLGLLFSASLIWWSVRTFLKVSDAGSAILVMCLGAVGIHAMLEFPLNYAYFLLPAGAMAGILNQRGGGRVWETPRWSFLAILTIAALLLAVVIRDYFRVESSYREARFENARIGTLPIGQPPDVIVLDQLSENINFMRYDVKEGMSTSQLDALVKVATAYPGGGRSYKVAKALALNGRASDASRWLRTVCKISDPAECAVIQQVWARDAANNPLIAAVPWPTSK
ncbi:hypothetical protein RD110_26350 [Rhodoferax koreense]|uniref:Virulence factor membrane-bound polymerase C-terminal domain-containing protein n=1 Tax=Rhodoferax koreensis TaxID=1842727 RepID=A0A1P8K2S0_9BURK|nr:O-antigen ligase family protein [Rhodoferax koreense]APW40287.1 hypothetical protein RD110_26350 [Rhodoferax koreense]